MAFSCDEFKKFDNEFVEVCDGLSVGKIVLELCGKIEQNRRNVAALTLYCGFEREGAEQFFRSLLFGFGMGGGCRTRAVCRNALDW